MRILIVCTYDYWNQSHVFIAKSAYVTLKSKFKDVDITMIPFYNSPHTYLDQALCYRGVSTDQADKVITFGPFAHLIEHNNKNAFVTSHLKNFYELWNSPLGELSNGITDNIKNKIVHLDYACLSESKANYCFYSKIQDRHPGVKINKVNSPKILLEKNINLIHDGPLLFLGDFNHENNFSIITSSLSKIHILKKRIIFAGRKQRIDIFDSIKKSIKKNPHSENIELIALNNNSQLSELISKSSIIIDTSIESDTLSIGLIESIRQRKPFVTFANSGLISEDFFSDESVNILDQNESSLDDFFNKSNHETELLKLNKYFASKYASYENDYISNFEDALV